jgi:pimeloyl-ACP methyl ester carboxylesterase
MFHVRSWAEAVASKPGNEVVVAFDTGHWVMTEQPARFQNRK